MDMTSVSAEGAVTSVEMPSMQTNLPVEVVEEPNTPQEVIDISKASFNLAGGKIIVTLKTKSGNPIQFAIGLDKFLVGINASVAFMNMHMTQFFDAIGGP